MKKLLPILILLGVATWSLWPDKPEPTGGKPLTTEQKLAQEPPLFAHVLPDGTVDAVVALTQETLDAKGGWYVDGVFKSKSEWIRTSKEGTIRKNYAGKGAKYDQSLDAFIPEKPAGATVFDSATARWIEPTIQLSTFVTSTST